MGGTGPISRPGMCGVNGKSGIGRGMKVLRYTRLFSARSTKYFTKIYQKNLA